VLRLGLGVCLCVCYSAIFTKTNRIFRIFHGCLRGNQKPAYISPRSQLLICLGKISSKGEKANEMTWMRARVLLKSGSD